MYRNLLTAVALSSLVFVGACSSNETPAARSGDTATAAQPANTAPRARNFSYSLAPAAANSTTPAEVQKAAENQAPGNHRLTKTIVIPPKPKPGAPHGPGFDMPLLDLGGYAPARPIEIVRDAHIFTADHPEVASFVPCYCGCGNAGHKDNADCFIRQRDAQGRVTEWEPHGTACAVCIDIAVQSMRMRNAGAPVSAIRQQVQNDYRSHFPSTETPTPAPPAGK